MQSEMLDLVGGSGEKPPSGLNRAAPSWDEIEFSEENLKEFATAPVRELADHYCWLLEVDPFARNRRAKQLRDVMHRRRISLAELDAARSQ